ncbi:MAG TPA: NAD-dependent epimerase/dehydratase family protein [Alphaproteobacteria bacterium]
MARYLVTGGCGFIASHLADALVARGDSVRILDDLSTGKRESAPEAAEVTVGDVADAALVRALMKDADGCFHLAAVASVQRANEDWVNVHRSNLTGAVAVFDGARQGRGGKMPVVYASSAAIYGDDPNVPLTEDGEHRPLTAYGADKLGCELHGRVAWQVHGVPTTGLRFFNVYGPRQDPASPYSGVIAIFADRIAARRPITIFGDGNQTRDFIFVADVVAHLLAAMERCAGGAQVFNVCTGTATSVLDLARTIGELAGHRPEIRHDSPRAGDIRVSIGDPRRATRALGVAATTALADGLGRTLRFGAKAG